MKLVSILVIVLICFVLYEYVLKDQYFTQNKHVTFDETNNQEISDESLIMPSINSDDFNDDMHFTNTIDKIIDDVMNDTIIEPTTKIIMEIKFGRYETNELIFELFDNLTPMTCHVFKQLLDKQHYKDAEIAYIEKNRYLKGGLQQRVDIDLPEEEIVKLKHNKPGLLSYHRPTTELIITLGPCQELDKRAVPIGFIIKGIETLQKINNIELFENKPTTDCFIENIQIWNE